MNDEWYKTNNCLDKARLFVLCMKTIPQTPNAPNDNKCKKIFDNWYKCILVDNSHNSHITHNHTNHLEKNIK
jgi:hypothetical protein